MADSARLVIFCGKGGVGKTTLSLAAGLKHAMNGRRVLVISSHPLGELALAVSLEGLSTRFPAAAPNLFVLYIDPRDLIADAVYEHFPAPVMAQKILNSSILTNLIEIAPGLKEFFFLGRLQELAERRKNNSATAPPDYDYLIWDAPASGHFLTTLRSAKNFEVFLTGPLATAGAQLRRFFSNRQNIQLIAVTPLEEMAIAETLEMAQSMDRDFGVACSALLVNFASAMCTATEADIAGLEPTSDSSPALRFAVERGLIERERCVELRAALPVVPQVLIPRITQWSSDLDLLTKIGERMDASHFS
ncbi:MAG: ArsA family ATPase [Bryobacteraceae bacterium]